MLEELAELWRFRYLLRMMVVREIKLRYKNSFLGFFWSIGPPVLQVLVFYFLFKHVFRLSAPNLTAYLLCGIIPWGFFTAAVLDSSQSLLANYTIIKKVYLPREIVPLAAVLSNLVHFALGWLVFFSAFFIVARVFGVDIPLLPSMVWFPVITVALVLLATGVSLWAAALNIFYYDVKFILQTTFPLLYFMLPILYPADLAYHNSHFLHAHPVAYKLYMLFPLTAIVDAYRKTLLQPVPSGSFGDKLPPLPFAGANLLCAAFISLVVAVAGYWYFNRKKWLFAERG